MNSFFSLWLTGRILAQAAVPTAQINTMMSGIQSFLEHFVMILGPIAFLVGLVAHGIGSSHNSNGMAQWGSRAMKAGAGIFIGALALTIVFATLQGLFG